MFLGDLSGPNAVTRVLKVELEGKRCPCWNDVENSAGHCWCEGGRGLQLREEARKGKKADFAQGNQKGIQPCPHLDFSPVRPASAF